MAENNSDVGPSRMPQLLLIAEGRLQEREAVVKFLNSRMVFKPEDLVTPEGVNAVIRHLASLIAAGAHHKQYADSEHNPPCGGPPSNPSQSRVLQTPSRPNEDVQELEIIGAGAFCFGVGVHGNQRAQKDSKKCVARRLGRRGVFSIGIV